jgi:REP element-mobilizing transposase RayT
MPDAVQYGRRSIRLKGFDYSLAGLYFVTICAEGHKRIFGRIFNGAVVLEPAGMSVRDVWLNLDKRFASAAFLDFVIMPNHFHGIVAIVDSLPRRGAASSAPTASPLTLSKVIRAFKSLSAIEVNRLLGRRSGAVWQRNFWEHIMGNEGEFRTVREYIRLNPSRWESDPENI